MIKLPRTLHIEGSRMKGEVDPDAVQFTTLKEQFLVVEEKVDGSGVSLWFDQNLDLQIYHRGSPATDSEFDLLRTWANVHQNELFELLDLRFVLFGEWMLLKHTIFYDNLPCHDHQPVYFLESDIYDQKSHCFLSTDVRKSLLTPYPFIYSVPVLKAFVPEKLSDITSLVGPSKYITKDAIEIMGARVLWNKLDVKRVFSETDMSDLMESLYIKHETGRVVSARYKYVRHEFL